MNKNITTQTGELYNVNSYAELGLVLVCRQGILESIAHGSTYGLIVRVHPSDVEKYERIARVMFPEAAPAEGTPELPFAAESEAESEAESDAESESESEPEADAESEPEAAEPPAPAVRVKAKGKVKVQSPAPVSKKSARAGKKSSPSSKKAARAKATSAGEYIA